MFICKSCADRVYGGIGSKIRSYGTCEECGKVNLCYSIHQSRLPERRPIPIGPTDNRTPVQELNSMSRNTPIKKRYK